MRWSLNMLSRRFLPLQSGQQSRQAENRTVDMSTANGDTNVQPHFKTQQGHYGRGTIGCWHAASYLGSGSFECMRLWLDHLLQYCINLELYPRRDNQNSLLPEPFPEQFRPLNSIRKQWCSRLRHAARGQSFRLLIQLVCHQSVTRLHWIRMPDAMVHWVVWTSLLMAFRLKSEEMHYTSPLLQPFRHRTQRWYSGVTWMISTIWAWNAIRCTMCQWSWVKLKRDSCYLTRPPV